MTPDCEKNLMAAPHRPHMLKVKLRQYGLSFNIPFATLQELRIALPEGILSKELMSALGSVGWALAIQSPTSMKHHSNHRFLALREGPSEESLHERLKARPEKATPEVHLRIFDLRSMRQLNAANAILIDERADCRGQTQTLLYIASEIDFATARAELMNIWASGLGVRFFTVMTIAQIFISSEWRFGAVRTQRTSPVDDGVGNFVTQPRSNLLFAGP